MDKMRITGILTLILGLLLLKVTATYAAPCTSAVAEIDPTSVNVNTDNQAFSYYIEPRISEYESGIRRIEIRVPDTYSNIHVTGVWIGGQSLSLYTDSTSGNTISVAFGLVNIDGTDLRVDFTADTPGAPDSGVPFTSLVYDDLPYVPPVSCTSGDGDGGGSIATNTWTVTAGYAGPCTSAVAEIDPTSVNVNTDNRAFSYYIEPRISEYDSGIDRIDIVAPGTYSGIIVTDVLVGGVPVSYVDNTSGNTISVAFATVNIDGTDLQVDFTAGTPGVPDSGVAFTSTVDHTGYPDAVSCTSGDGDDGGSVTANTWTVTAGYAGSCTSAVAEIDPTSVNYNTHDQAFSYYIEPRISEYESGINSIEIRAPNTYSDIHVTGVWIGGQSLSLYTDNTSGNTISVAFATVNIDGTDLQVDFTADTPEAPDSGVAFTSTVDHTGYPDPVDCTSGDGDDGGSIATNTWTVTARYAGSCTSAVAEIDPTSNVNVNTDNQAFSYYIEPTISEYDFGIDRIDIVAPGTYSDIIVTDVLVGGVPVSYVDNTSGNTISVVTSVKVTTDGEDLQVNFTADTPGAPDSGVAFTSTVHDTGYPDAVSCAPGDGDGGGTITTNTWTVTARYAGSCTSAVAEIHPISVNHNTDDQAFSYYIEPRISEYESGINSIEIRAPDTYSDIHVTGVWIGGHMDIFTDYSSGNTISVVTSVKVTTDGADLRVNFTADTPGVPDSGVAFTSTVDDTEYPGSVSCTSGDGDGGGGIATNNTWTVTAGYPGPCTSAVAEIDPIYVNINTEDQAFSYFILPTINADDSGVDKIEIRAPDTYSGVKVTGVSVGGDTSSEYDSNTVDNTILVTLPAKVTKNGTQLRVNFTADTPGAVDSGGEFTSTLYDTEYPASVSCTSGDGDGGGSVSTNTWVVTSPVSDGGNGCFIGTAACGFTMEPYRPSHK
jgi:hypothetical protein